MANILDRYGIKEVADVTFYKINDDGKPDYPVLFLDTLKVSTIEQTGEQAEARGGKGNPPLIIWDYGKEINVTLEDALFSAKSMAIMFGNGTVKTYTGDGAYIMKTEQFKATGDGFPSSEGSSDGAKWNSGFGWTNTYEGPDGKIYPKINPKFYDVNGTNVTGTGEDTLKEGDTYFCSFDLKVDGAVIEISANSFPGTYYVTGDTYARSEVTGDDEMFQFIIAKAKVQSENTITLEAEGDPSVFNMSLRVMRPTDGKMMKLVKYNLVEDPAVKADEESNVAKLDHNHDLTPANRSTETEEEDAGTT